MYGSCLSYNGKIKKVKLTLLQTGKTKDKWLLEGIAEYQKRISAYSKFQIIDLPDESIKNSGNANIVKAKEANTILKAIKPDDYVILLDEKGEPISSLAFADFLVNISDKNVVFVIGGVFGVDENIRKRANKILSLSHFTFTHRLARLVLCEQIYRALMIINNRNYHN
ncbi:MAG TPA: 23S rRNA (pseudouridine(1915)-N(3))-methyltransferase RlmH [Candidatus Cloacimonas sp.]|nr:23S rRNA (pseudouridine(1915)-N(3))-methyltransferase RlmH [Candidatus Cloacimonadota bacterium]HOG26948.1 23S rRNA (pseudouridine(1915)-N(3))-methyltransferase RlmH [Candidatus Cloacimonas sp.]HPH71439.1 23S rRNA (pseudouridine(1915)-N(3))-methyltransferase RlmH [Candidatus Cloacimonas sp.]HQM16981.1 23S rRNA (pseudouridine(1915)-N(3))-methyltransferase RlmH [Candidatus Cloacimonas sp.]HRR50497.1 23S rRNA (pseudouridine(1915)-N(3))-methyltransferase RlmH [Candidatus Cloacimonas sp.]